MRGPPIKVVPKSDSYYEKHDAVFNAVVPPDTRTKWIVSVPSLYIYDSLEMAYNQADALKRAVIGKLGPIAQATEFIASAKAGTDYTASIL